MKIAYDNTSDERIVREQECARKTGLSRTQRWRLAREGRFPQPVALSDRSIGWLESEINEWIAQRSADRNPQQSAA